MFREDIRRLQSCHVKGTEDTRQPRFPSTALAPDKTDTLYSLISHHESDPPVTGPTGDFTSGHRSCLVEGRADSGDSFIKWGTSRGDARVDCEPRLHLGTYEEWGGNQLNTAHFDTLRSEAELLLT